MKFIPPPNRLSQALRIAKKFALYFSILILMLIFLNIGSYFILKDKFNLSIYDLSEYKLKKQEFLKDERNQSIPHPYYGIIGLGWERFPNQLTGEPLFNSISTSTSNKKIKVLILGGSVAQDLSLGANGIYKNLLASKLNSYFKTDRFEVYNAAIAGGKQPQQYFKYIYLDLLNFHPDIVINLDGFNEIALPLSENKNLQIPAIFPRAYSRLLASQSVDRGCVNNSNKLLNFNSQFPVIELINWLYIRNCHSKIESFEDRPSWSAAIGIEDNTDYLSQSIQIWKSSSQKLNIALKNRNIDYIHILQPNQYLKGSKNFSQEEIEKYLNFPIYGAQIEKYYGLLSKIDSEEFIDQRYLFSNEAHTVYRDNCCHFNNYGMEKIIENIILTSKHIFIKHLKSNSSNLP